MIDIMAKDSSSLANVLRNAIESSGVSYLHLERETGVSRGSISRFVNGERDLYLESASKISAFLGLKLKKSTKSKNLGA